MLIAGDYSFSLATYADIPEIARLYRGLIGTPGCTWDADYPSEATAESDIDSETLYILKKDGRIVAAASAGDFGELAHLQWAPNRPCELARIGVLRAMQGRGLGTLILQNVMRTVSEKGFDGIRMLVSKTNPAALALYEKNGFERCGEVYMFEHDFYRYQIQFGAQRA